MSYRGRCVGRIVDVLRKIDYNLDAIMGVGDGVVEVNYSPTKKRICTFEWEFNTDKPVFTFVDDYESYNTCEFRQDRYRQVFADEEQIDHLLNRYPVDWRKYDDWTWRMDGLGKNILNYIDGRTYLENFLGIDFSDVLKVRTYRMKSIAEFQKLFDVAREHYYGSAWQCVPNQYYDEMKAALAYYDAQTKELV